jgi:hypothetical protein
METTYEIGSSPVLDDSRILDEVRHALVEEPLLGDCCVHPNGSGYTARATALFPEGIAGFIIVAVKEAVVTLSGNVSNSYERRLAGEVASRASGGRRVVNDLVVGDT